MNEAFWGGDGCAVDHILTRFLPLAAEVVTPQEELLSRGLQGMLVLESSLPLILIREVAVFDLYRLPLII